MSNPTEPSSDPSHKPASSTKPRKGDQNYRDRPTDDGEHGDGAAEPNAGFPHKAE